MRRAQCDIASVQPISMGGHGAPSLAQGLRSSAPIGRMRFQGADAPLDAACVLGCPGAHAARTHGGRMTDGGRAPFRP